jgi:hypothetical protein
MLIREALLGPCLTPEELGLSPAAPTRVLRQGLKYASRMGIRILKLLLQSLEPG